jgi:UDP-4-amino-4-deoxy-L-arabinose-oxoglutarate aminotransferase
VQRIPFSRPRISEAAIAAVADVLRSGWITSGPQVLAFESAFAAFCRAPHAVAVCSATAGLDLALAALGIGPGDEVIVPSINWVSGPNMIACAGAEPVLCDVTRAGMQIDLDDAERRITPRTRAIMPVHYAGAPCDLAGVRALAARHRLRVIEDAAHAAGTTSRGAPIGHGSDLAVFSFHPTKNLTTAEGGMIVTGDAELAARLRLLRFHGIRKDAWKHHGRSGKDVYQVLEPARKYNLTDMQAALGLAQLAELPAMNADRARQAARYRRELSGLRHIHALASPLGDGDTHAWHIFVVTVDGDRAAVVDRLEADGIGTAIHYPAVHEQEWYRARAPGTDLPNASWASSRLLSIPLYPDLSEAEQGRVIAALQIADAQIADSSRAGAGSGAPGRSAV